MPTAAKAETTAENPHLPPGFDDVASDFYVPPSLRGRYRRDATAERHRLQTLAPDRPVMASVGGRRRDLWPHRVDADAELWLHLTALATAEARRKGDEVAAERAARDAVAYRCDSCAVVVTPTGMGGDAATRLRHLKVAGDRVRAKLCGDCNALVMHRSREGARLPDGRTRAAAADAFLAGLRATP